jgi:hypothetical protein
MSNQNTSKTNPPSTYSTYSDEITNKSISQVKKYMEGMNFTQHRH